LVALSQGFGGTTRTFGSYPMPTTVKGANFKSIPQKIQMRVRELLKIYVSQALKEAQEVGSNSLDRARYPLYLGRINDAGVFWEFSPDVGE